MSSPRISRALSLLPLLCWLAAGRLLAVDGQPDPYFGSGGALVIPWNYGGNLWDVASDVVADDSTNSLFVVGSLASETADYDWGIARISAGQVVTRQRTYFDLGGTNTDIARAAVLDGAGGLVVTGDSQTADRTVLHICRYSTTTLALDPAFGSGGCGGLDLGASIYLDAWALARAGDGGYVIAGAISQAGGSDFLAAKFDASGQLDANFGFFGVRVIPFDLGGRHVDVAQSAAVDVNGDVLLAGSAESGDGQYSGALARLTAQGNLDLTFGGGTGKLVVTMAPGSVNFRDVEVDPLSGTGFYLGVGVDPNNAAQTLAQVWRYDGSGNPLPFPNGQPILDATWDPTTTNSVSRVVLQSDGALLVAGSSAWGQVFRASRFTAQGDPDLSWNGSGSAAFDVQAHGLGSGAGVASAALSGGRLVVAGSTDQGDWNWLVLRFTEGLAFRGAFESGNFAGWILHCAVCG